LLDTDVKIVETTGRTIADIFANDGEREFRRIEECVVKTALAEHDGILSLGGGAITSPGVRAALSGHTVVYLEINAAEGIRRTTSGTVRPLLAGADPAEKYRTLMVERVPLYRQVATMRVNTNRRNPGAVVRYLTSRLDRRLENPLPDKQNRRRRRAPWRLSPAPQAKPEQSGSAATPEGPPTPATAATMAARRAEVRHD
jgi:shikimate kinase